MGLGFTFSYSPVTNQYHFSQFAISIAGAFEYQIPVPLHPGYLSYTCT